MGVSDTFECLQSFSAREQLACCLAALEEQHTGLQCAAMQSLMDPGQLGRAELVVERFDGLTPQAVEFARRWSDQLVTLATQRIESGSPEARLASFRLVAELSGSDGVELLVRGLEDSIQDVRRIAFAAIERWVRRLVAARREAADGGGPELLGGGSEMKIWAAFEACVRSFPKHRRTVFLELLPEFGRKSVALVAHVLEGPRRGEFVEAIIEVLVISNAPDCIELVLALAAHESTSVAIVGRRVLQRRDDEDFRVALAERAVGLAESSMVGIHGEVGGGILSEAVPHLDRETAVGLLQRSMTQTADPVEKQARVEAFLGHPTAGVKIAALAAMRQLGCPNGFESIGRLLRGGEDRVRLAAARVVVELAPPNRAALLIPLLGSADAEARELAVREVSQFSLPRFVDRFDALDERGREIAARAIAKIDPHLVERLTEEFKSFDSERRIKALKVVELLDAGAEVRDAVLAMLGEVDVRVRATAIRIVCATGSVAGTKVLIDALSDSDRRVRANAIEAFEQLDDQSYLELLIPFLRDRDNRVRANAAKALWNLGWPDARDVLIKMLNDGDARMRSSATWAIGEVRFYGASEVLQARDLAERDPSVRERIRATLAALESTSEETR